jgi:hypothetical protein
MSQLADPMMVNEVSRALMAYPFKPVSTAPVGRKRAIVCAGSGVQAQSQVAVSERAVAVAEEHSGVSCS